MLLYVYRLRRRGARQSKADMANEGARVDLQLLPYESGWHGRRWLLAYAYDPGTRDEALPRIEQARVLRVREALTIAGIEAVPKGRKNVERYQQTWGCSVEPIAPERWPEIPRAAGAYSGFDPAEDDIAY